MVARRIGVSVSFGHYAVSIGDSVVIRYRRRLAHSASLKFSPSWGFL